MSLLKDFAEAKKVVGITVFVILVVVWLVFGAGDCHGDPDDVGEKALEGAVDVAEELAR